MQRIWVSTWMENGQLCTSHFSGPDAKDDAIAHSEWVKRILTGNASFIESGISIFPFRTSLTDWDDIYDEAVAYIGKVSWPPRGSLL